MRIKEKVVAAVSFLLITVLGVTLAVSNSNLKESNVEKKVKFSTFETWHGAVESTAYFTTNSNNIAIDNNNYTISHYLNNDSLENNEMSIHFYSVFDDNLSTPFNPGELMYILPTTTPLFYVPDYEAYVIDESENKVTFYADVDFADVIGYLKLGTEIKYCELDFDSDSLVTGCDGNYNYYWYYNPEGLVITNGNEISGNYTVDLSATYAMDPNYFEGIDNYLEPQFMLWLDDYYAYDSYYISVTDRPVLIDFSNIEQQDEVVYENWQSEWGTERTQHDYYVKYPISGYVDDSETYFVNFNVASGNVVAFSGDNDTYQTGDRIDFNEIGVCNLDTSGYSDVNCYIVVGYNTGDSQLDFDFAIGMSGTGGATKQFNWTTTLGPKNNNVEPEYPAGISADFVERSTSPDAGEGAINKLLNGGSVNTSWLIEANGTSSINNGYKAFNMWNLTEGGTKPYEVYIDSGAVYINGNIINVNNSSDSNIISFYPQDDKEYNYVLENNSYKLSPVTDYSTYTAKDVYAVINGGSLEKIGSYVRTGSNIVYTAVDSRTTSNNNVSETNPIILPTNTTQLLVKYNGVRAAVYLGINVNTKLNGTDSVKNLIGDASTVSLNNSSGRAYPGVFNHLDSYIYLTKMEITSHADKTSTVGDRIDDGRTDVISYTDRFYDQLNYNEDTRAEALSMLPEQKNGTIYELLPAGAELYGNVMVKTIGNGNCSITTNTQDHYANTNRTLLTINIGTCSSNYYDTGTAIQSGYKVNYSLKYTAAANQSYGTTLYSDAMYVATSQLGQGYSSAEEAPSSKFSSNSVKTIFDNLVTGNNNLLFATNTTVVENLSVTEGEYNKSVQTGTGYSSSTSVVESKTYTYKLQYSFTSELEEITNVIMIDKLENHDGGNPKFKGYLENVDVQYLQSIGVNPTVYYSIFDVNTSTFDISQWTTTKPDDVSTIKAIAVDCGSYVFEMGKAPEVLVTLKAPTNYENNKKAYNESNILYKYPGESNVKHLESEVTTVSLQKANISVTGTSNFGTGTSSSPAIIDGDLKYTFTIKNNDSVNSFDNVVVEITIPEGMTTNDATVSNNKALYTIDHLNASETKTLELNMQFVGTVNSNSTYTASYKLTKLNGLDYNGTMGNIYNKVELPAIEAHKYVKTIDSGNFTDEADVLVKTDEEFSYRVSIKNTSNKIANNVIVKDTVPSGLNIVTSSIGNGIISGNTITWDVNVNANSTLNIDYKVKLASNATLGSVYRSSANVQLANPYLPSLMIFDDDTNITSVLYQIASSVKVTNTLSGSLASTTKEFEYEVAFTGSSSNAGRYNVYGANNQALTPLDINESGSGSYTFKLKGSETLTFKNLTGGINYTIKQKKETGYTTHVNVNESTNGNYVVTSGSTTNEGTTTYTFTNVYSAQGQATINAKVTYDKTITNNMFKVSVDGVEQNIPASGVMSGVTKTYNNQVGNYTYVVKQVNTNQPKVSYDSTEFKAVVTVTDNGAGQLNAQVKYYKGTTEVDEIVFNNTYLPNGLTIKNVNNSDYVVPDKEFNYKIELYDGTGEYTVKDDQGNELDSILFMEGYAVYNFTLLSNKSILIEDLPDNVRYTITQNKVEYYTTTSEDEYTSEEEKVLVSGVTVNGSKEIKFINKYETKASFEPEIKVMLEGKDLEEAEFKFKLTDISSGPTNGYTSNALNDEEGKVLFNKIDFTRPGTYKYEMIQLNNGSNHIYFDFSKVLLTLTLTDNGDGTMNIESAYEYVNGMEYLLNKYSEEPIVPETEDETQDKNPNTGSRITVFVILLWIVAILFVVERWVRMRRLKMNA